MSENNDKIYYYTSDFVFLEWLKKEKIWATRSISSNDASDTIYARRHFDKLKEIFSTEKYKRTEYNFNHEIQKAEELLNLSKNFSLRVCKDILKDFVSNKFDDFNNIIRNVNKIYEFINKPIIPTKEGLKMNEKVCLYRFCKDGNVRLNSRELEREEILFDMILSSLSKDEIKKYLNIKDKVSEYRVEELPTVIYPYVISFTYNKDDRFLWDSYTDNMGVCLEFSKEEMKDYWKNQDSKYNKECLMNIYLEDVIYDEKEQVENLKDIIDEMVNDSVYYNIGEALSFVSTICKSPYWKPENECRAVFGAKYFSDERFKVKENYNLKYNSGYKTQDYIEIPFPKRLLKSITTGPMNSKESLEKDIKKGLDRDIKNDSEKNNILDYFNKLKKESSSGEGIIRK